MGKDHVGRSRVARGCYGRVVIAPQEPAGPIEPESLDSAVDRKVGSIVRLKDAVVKLCPSNVRPHQLVRERVVAPKGIAEEIDQIQAVPAGGDGGVLEMLTRVGALLEHLAAG